MKRVISVSLGSSKRDHKVELPIMGEEFSIERRGTDGDMRKAEALLRELDGNVDAIGLGGIDIYLYSRKGRYALKDGLKLMNAVQKTPVVDGSGLKNTLEREVVRILDADGRFHLKDSKVLMVCAMDRFGMAEAFIEAGCSMVFGDMMFSLDRDQPIYSIEELAEYAEKLLPEISKLPIGFIYPIGKKQDLPPEEKYRDYYHNADFIAGDYHFIRKYLPAELPGKHIITNTVTAEDIEMLKARGVKYLITTTPEFQGRSFGTNVLEAVLLAMLGKRWQEVTAEEYLDLIKRLELKPRIEILN
ncbi:MAG: quinate 5-dehydrogenase [Candidatus Eremiobacteraeota bacterium]|nr:quinate 5-dehydrogenase [Candidatus Eremiobacteraeota bacterium]